MTLTLCKQRGRVSQTWTANENRP